MSQSLTREKLQNHLRCKKKRRSTCNKCWGPWIINNVHSHSTVLILSETIGGEETHTAPSLHCYSAPLALEVKRSFTAQELQTMRSGQRVTNCSSSSVCVLGRLKHHSHGDGESLFLSYSGSTRPICRRGGVRMRRLLSQSAVKCQVTSLFFLWKKSFWSWNVLNKIGSLLDSHKIEETKLHV